MTNRLPNISTHALIKQDETNSKEMYGDDEMKKDKPNNDNASTLAEDISIIPDAFIDATMFPLYGGLLTRYYVEVGNEMFLNEELRNSQFKDEYEETQKSQEQKGK